MPKNKRHKKKPLLTKLEVAVLVLTLYFEIIGVSMKRGSRVYNAVLWAIIILTSISIIFSIIHLAVR